jgi:hypothetical protein
MASHGMPFNMVRIRKLPIAGGSRDSAMSEPIRRVIFSPYGRRTGPHFALTLWDTGRTENHGFMSGKNILRYRLSTRGRPLFQGENFACSPLHAIDSDATVRAIMGFLTLRPGDTDAEYFTDYTPAQTTFCEQHAEYLAYEVMNRFGED